MVKRLLFNNHNFHIRLFEIALCRQVANIDSRRVFMVKQKTTQLHKIRYHHRDRMNKKKELT